MKCSAFIFFVAYGLICTAYSDSYSSDYPIVDTGQTSCYDNDGALMNCPAAGEEFYGQDAQTDGNQFSYTDNGDGTVTDNVTELMWQQTPPTTGSNYETANEYCESLELGGYDDWRLPNVKEMQSIIDYNHSPSASDPTNLGPAIDTVFFTISELPTGTTAYAPDYGYFGSSTSAYFGGDSLEYYYAWYVAFGTAVNDDVNDSHGAGGARFGTKYEGGPLGEGSERYYNYVRLVRNAQHLVDLNRDGIVDRSDISILKRYIRRSADTCQECDLDDDGRITARDAKKLISLCTYSGCTRTEFRPTGHGQSRQNAGHQQ